MPATATASLKVSGFEGQSLLVNANDAFVSAKLLQQGVWEEYETRLFLELLTPDSVVLDIGANLGYYTVLASKVCQLGRVLSFEPEPFNFSLLTENVRYLPQHFCQPEIFNLALGNANGDLDLYTSDENPGDHQSYNRGDGRQSVNVKVCEGDQLLNDLARVDLIKIDVQGAEQQVLTGLFQLIQRSLPSLAIICEFYPKGLAFAGGSALQFYRLLETYGLKILVIDHVKYRLWDFDRCEIIDWINHVDSDDANEGFMNLLLVPESYLPRLADHFV